MFWRECTDSCLAARKLVAWKQNSVMPSETACVLCQQNPGYNADGTQLSFLASIQSLLQACHEYPEPVTARHLRPIFHFEHSTLAESQVMLTCTNIFL